MLEKLAAAWRDYDRTGVCDREAMTQASCAIDRGVDDLLVAASDDIRMCVAQVIVATADLDAIPDRLAAMMNHLADICGFSDSDRAVLRRYV